MKLKKILASVAASALAVSAISANVFAADPVTVTLDDSYKGDWAQAGIITKENFDKFEGDVKVVLTVEATNVGEGVSYLMKPMEADKGWDAVTSKLTTAKEVAKPDGFIAIHYDQTEVEFVVPSAMRADMWDGGLSFQVSNIIIKSAVLSDGEAEQAFGVVEDADTNAFCAASVNAPAETEAPAVDPDSADFKATLGGQLNSEFNATVGEWPADAEAYGNYTNEVTITWDFGAEKVKLAGNYLGIKTNVPFNTEEGAANAEVTVSSIKADDRDVTFDASKVFVGDNDSEAGTIKITLMNEWDSNVQGNPAVDFNAVNGDEGFSKLSITFTIGELPAAEAAETTTEATEATEAPATEATEAPAETEATAPESTTEAPAPETTVAPAVPTGDTNNAAASDKGNADTGIEGVAIVAAIAVLAGGAVVIAKKRK